MNQEFADLIRLIEGEEYVPHSLCENCPWSTRFTDSIYCPFKTCARERIGWEKGRLVEPIRKGGRKIEQYKVVRPAKRK